MPRGGCGRAPAWDSAGRLLQDRGRQASARAGRRGRDSSRVGLQRAGAARGLGADWTERGEAAPGRRALRLGGVPVPPREPPPGAAPRPPAAPSRERPAELTVRLSSCRRRIGSAAPCCSARRRSGGVGHSHSRTLPAEPSRGGRPGLGPGARSRRRPAGPSSRPRRPPEAPSPPARPAAPSRMSPRYFLRSLLLLILAAFSANASNWL